MVNILEWIQKLLGITSKADQLLIKYRALKGKWQPLIDALGPEAQGIINRVDAEITAILAEEG